MSTDPSSTPTRTAWNQEIGANARGHMARLGRKQSDLAVVLGVSQQQLSERLAGRVSWLAVEVLAAAEALGVPVSELMPDSLITAPNPTTTTKE